MTANHLPSSAIITSAIETIIRKTTMMSLIDVDDDETFSSVSNDSSLNVTLGGRDGARIRIDVRVTEGYRPIHIPSMTQDETKAWRENMLNRGVTAITAIEDDLHTTTLPHGDALIQHIIHGFELARELTQQLAFRPKYVIRYDVYDILDVGGLSDEWEGDKANLEYDSEWEARKNRRLLDPLSDSQFEVLTAKLKEMEMGGMDPEGDPVDYPDAYEDDPLIPAIHPSESWTTDSSTPQDRERRKKKGEGWMSRVKTAFMRFVRA